MQSSSQASSLTVLTGVDRFQPNWGFQCWLLAFEMQILSLESGFCRRPLLFLRTIINVAPGIQAGARQRAAHQESLRPLLCSGVTGLSVCKKFFGHPGILVALFPAAFAEGLSVPPLPCNQAKNPKIYYIIVPRKHLTKHPDPRLRLHNTSNAYA